MEIERRRFVDTLSYQSGSLDTRYMSSELRGALRDAGIDDAHLSSIAGSDHVIRGAEFDALYSALDARGSATDRPTGDLDRSARLFALLEREVDRGRAGEGTDAVRVDSGTRPRTGLRGATGNERRIDGAEDTSRSSGGARLGIRYAAPITPEPRMTETPPERPNWFVRVLEFLFGWLPGVSTDHERLEEHGRSLADTHESEIMAYQEAYRAERMSETRSNGLPPTPADIDAEIRENMVTSLATRMQAQGLDADVARERAGVVVDAMLARVQTNREANRGRAAALNIPAPTSAEGRATAELAVPARRTADQLGGAWPARMQQALTPPSDSHPFVAAQVDREHKDRAKAYLMGEQVRTVTYLMALERSGDLHLPASAIDGLLAANRAQMIGSGAVAGAASALSRMPEADRNALLQGIESLPPDRRAIGYAALAREYVALGSSNPSEVAGARARITNATQQLRTMTTAEAETALRRGTLGLDGPRTLHLDYGQGRTIDVPVYFHPTLTQEQRDRQFELIREAYGHMPYALMQRVSAAEGDESFNIQVLPNGSLNSGLAEPERPQGLSDTGAFYRTGDNEIRLNASVFEDIMRNDPNGRSRVVGMILHETVHDLDDLGDTDQNLGFFIGGQDAARDRDRTTGAGDLAPAWAHYRAAADRFHENSTNVGESRRATAYYVLGRKGDARTPAEDAEYARLGRDIARRSGAMSPYAAESGVTSRGGQLGEWWAETYSSYLNPATRADLQRTDPVAYQACVRYTQLLEGGARPDEALRSALRFSLSTEVAAEQGTTMLRGAPRTGSMSDAQLTDLEAIGTAFEQHATALDGWRPYADDASLKGMRRSEAADGVTEGRRMIEAIAARRAQLAASGQTGSAEDRRLEALSQRMERAVQRLDDHVRRLAPTTGTTP